MITEELIRIKPDELEWFVSHYEESKKEILEMLWGYIKNAPLTAHDCYIGCSHLNQINELTNAKISLNTHLEIISEMSLVGINASKAAQHIKVALRLAPATNSSLPIKSDDIETISPAEDKIFHSEKKSPESG